MKGKVRLHPSEGRILRKIQKTEANLRWICTPYPSHRKRLMTFYANRLRRLRQALRGRATLRGLKKELSIGKAARVLAISTKTLIRWEESGIIRCRRSPGNHRRIPRSELQRLLRERIAGKRP